MNTETELKKQACIDYIYGIEKEALEVAPIIQAGRALLGTPAGKTIATGAAVGALSGFLNPKKVQNFDGSVTKGSRLKSMASGALTGTAAGAIGVGAKKALPFVQDGLKNGFKNPFNNVTASEVIETIYMNKVASDNGEIVDINPENANVKPVNPNVRPIQSPNTTSPKMPQIQPTLNPQVSSKMNADMGTE